MKIEFVFNTLKYISAISVISPLIACILKIKTLDLTLRVLFVYVAISALSEICSYFFITNNIHNYIVRNTYTFLELTSLTILYFIQFQENKSRTVIVVAYFLIVILTLIIFFCLGKFNEPDNIVSTIESAFFIILSYVYIYKLMKDIANSSFSESYFIWINNAILIYFSLTFVLFLFIGYIEKFRIEGYYFVYSLHLIANVLLNVLISIGVWKRN